MNWTIASFVIGIIGVIISICLGVVALYLTWFWNKKNKKRTEEINNERKYIEEKVLSLIPSTITHLSSYLTYIHFVPTPKNGSKSVEDFVTKKLPN